LSVIYQEDLINAETCRGNTNSDSPRSSENHLSGVKWRYLGFFGKVSMYALHGRVLQKRRFNATNATNEREKR
jgi:hypothetical protein